MTAKLTTLKQMLDALAEDGAVLVKQGHYRNEGYYVRRPNGQRLPCTSVADRLTWVRKDKPAAVTFMRRTGLEIFYVPTGR